METAIIMTHVPMHARVQHAEMDLCSRENDVMMETQIIQMPVLLPVSSRDVETDLFAQE